MTGPYQSKIAKTPDTDPRGDDDGTEAVWVVTTRRDGDPHSHVEGVYDNEAAAEAHKRKIAQDSFNHRAIAWGVHAKVVASEVSDDE